MSDTPGQAADHRAIALVIPYKTAKMTADVDE
jgi:hypothetical protein